MGYRPNHHEYQHFSTLEDGDRIYRVYFNERLEPVYMQVGREKGEVFVLAGGKMTKAGLKNCKFEVHITGGTYKDDARVLDEAITEILLGNF